MVLHCYIFFCRVSEEKEESVQRLKDEQEHFECKLQKLEQQNVIIVQERESILWKLLGNWLLPLLFLNETVAHFNMRMPIALLGDMSTLK